jgi:hypothetical protein
VIKKKGRKQMNRKRIAVLLLGCLAGLFLAVHPASAATPCVVTSTTSTAAPTPVDLNAEGLTERPTDIKISGVGCFNTGSTVFVEYGVVMSVPTSFGLGDRGVYWDFADSTDSLSLDSITITQPLSPSGFVTKIEFHVNFGTTNPAAYIILENLRFDVTGTTGTNFQSVADGNPLNVFVGIDNPSSTGSMVDVGNVKKTIKPLSASVDQIGYGFENGVCPNPPSCGFPNKGATTGSLIQQAEWEFSTNPTWVTDFPFRRLNEASGNPTDPNKIGPTDLVVDVENIEAGVTVTLPSAMNICGAATTEGGIGAIVATWTLKSGGPSATGGNLVGIYQTTLSTNNLPKTLVVDTTNGAPDPGCDARTINPLISVVLGNPSLNNALGNMTTSLRVVMGPAPTAQFTGDDAQPSAVPRYLNYIGDASEPTREIIGLHGNAVPYFFLNPTRTVLLYPYVSNLFGWNTGIEVGNTGNDGAIFGNSGQNGQLDIYFFPSGAAPFVYTAKAGNGRGLDSTGDLDAGGDFAITLDDLLADAGHPGNFDGYIIIVAHFNFGHGTAMIFTTNSTTSVPALVLGGNCSFNANKAMGNINGGPGGNSCSSAREGDLTRLPERLDQ